MVDDSFRNLSNGVVTRDALCTQDVRPTLGSTLGYSLTDWTVHKIRQGATRWTLETHGRRSSVQIDGETTRAETGLLPSLTLASDDDDL